MNEFELKTIKQIDDGKYRVPINTLKLGKNYKDITVKAIEKSKSSMLEELKRGRNPQLYAIITDARVDHDGEIIGGYHQYFAIKDILEKGWKDSEDKVYSWPYGDRVWVDPVMPADDNDAKAISLKSNSQYDIPSHEKVAEYAYSLIDSDVEVSNIPVISDLKEVTLLDVFDMVGPEDKSVPTKEPEEKEDNEKQVECPNCGTKFYVEK